MISERKVHDPKASLVVEPSVQLELSSDLTHNAEAAVDPFLAGTRHVSP